MPVEYVVPPRFASYISPMDVMTFLRAARPSAALREPDSTVRSLLWVHAAWTRNEATWRAEQIEALTDIRGELLNRGGAAGG